MGFGTLRPKLVGTSEKNSEDNSYLQGQINKYFLLKKLRIDTKLVLFTSIDGCLHALEYFLALFNLFLHTLVNTIMKLTKID
jgi:hypothetical protein